MNLYKFLVVIIGLIAFSSLNLAAQGRDVYVFLKDGSQHFGELIIARDSVVITSQVVVKDDEKLVEIADYMELAFFKDIDSIYVKKYTPRIYPAGMQIAGSMGGLAGYKAGESEGFGTALLYSIGGSIAGGLFGAGIDWVVRSVMSDEAAMLYPATLQNAGQIREYSRFKKSEPMYVRDIIDNLLKETK